jgi:hypothetical protein
MENVLLPADLPTGEKAQAVESRSEEMIRRNIVERYASAVIMTFNDAFLVAVALLTWQVTDDALTVDDYAYVCL